MMNARKFAVLLAFVPTGALLVGCGPKMSMDNMQDMVPERPAELDLLNSFVGKWSFEGTGSSPDSDEPIKMTGEEEYHWSGDMWYLVGDGVYRMEGMGEMKGHAVWAYDMNAKKFRSLWVDSMGSFGTGENTYDADTRTWHTTATSNGAMGKTTMKGTMKNIDDDTLEWSMTEYAGFAKTMEMTGTSRRVK